MQEYLTIRGGAEPPHHWCARTTGADTGGHGALTSGVEIFIGYILNLVDVFLVDAKFLEYGLAQFLGHGLGVDIEDGSAHDDGLMEETFGLGHAHQCAYFTATAGFAKNCDIIGVASELGDVVAYPFEGLYGIEHTDIARVLVFLTTGGEI